MSNNNQVASTNNKPAVEVKQVVQDVNKVAVDMEKLKDDEIFKLEAEIKKKLEAVQAERANRIERIKASTFAELKKTIDKAIEDEIFSLQDLSTFVLAEKYVVLPTPTVIELVAGKKPKKEKSDGSSGKGRRAIADEDVLFSFAYVAENGRNQTLKFDAESKMPAPASSSFKVLKDLQAKNFAELKQYFTPKFFEFAKTDESFRWVETLFPKIQADIDALVKAK